MTKNLTHGKRTETHGVCSDLISRRAAIDAIMGEPTDAHYPSWYADRIKSLPSAEPKTGEWAYKANGNIECSLCGRERQIGWTNFCGGCGARMTGGEE